MSRTTQNRRKKANRRDRCYWCGKSGHDAEHGICYKSYLLSESDPRMFCSDECCGAFNDRNERLRKKHVTMIAEGGECRVYQGGEFQYSFPVTNRPTVFWTAIG